MRILYACVAGGRSWGISSPDADYDIRFIFANELPWYLSIDGTRKDTIAFQLGAQVRSPFPDTSARCL